MLEQISKVCLAHFLCSFDPRSRKRFTEDVIREVSLPFFSGELVERFIDERLQRFQQTLVEEFNAREAGNRPLRYQIADSAGVGEVVAGFSHKTPQEIRLQNALHKITSSEFEKLSAIILKLLGCTTVYSTPSSHDQGIDAFGYRDLLTPTPYGVVHGLTWIAQAKHYDSLQIGSGDLREFVGSKELLVYKVFSTVDVRYKELELRPYAPIALAMITTEEIPNTVRRLSEGAGVFVFAASDIFHLLQPKLAGITVKAVRELIRTESNAIRTLF